jgi:hypothetical protein
MFKLWEFMHLLAPAGEVGFDPMMLLKVCNVPRIAKIIFPVSAPYDLKPNKTTNSKQQ